MLIDTHLAQRLEHADARHNADYATVREQLWPGVGARAAEVASGYAIYTGAEFPINRAVGLGMDGPVASADIDQVEQFYQAHGLPAEIDLCPYADPSVLHLLGERGYHVKRFFNVHVRSIAPSGIEPLPSNDVTVSQVAPHDADRWIKTVTDGFGGTAPPDEVGVALARIASSKPGASCFLASVDGEPAGGGAMVVRDGVALLFSASTRSQFRSQGVQTALITARLQAAARAGCDLAMVLTTPGSASERNIQRAGFRVAYTKPTMIQR
jgi:GNAT superfamily N-acetyltransferase